MATPILGIIAAVLAIGVLLALIALLRTRGAGYVIAVVDVVHTANLGGGSNLGIAFERNPVTRRVDGIVAAPGSKADVRIRKLRGDRFEVRDSSGSRVVASGEPVEVGDGTGSHHELVLRAFAGKAASSVSVRR